MFRPLIVLFVILLHIFATSARITIKPPVATCKVSGDCKHFGHDHVDCIQEKCVTLQHQPKKRSRSG